MHFFFHKHSAHIICSYLKIEKNIIWSGVNIHRRSEDDSSSCNDIESDESQFLGQSIISFAIKYYGCYGISSHSHTVIANNDKWSIGMAMRRWTLRCCTDDRTEVTVTLRWISFIQSCATLLSLESTSSSCTKQFIYFNGEKQKKKYLLFNNSRLDAINHNSSEAHNTLHIVKRATVNWTCMAHTHRHGKSK